MKNLIKNTGKVILVYGFFGLGVGVVETLTGGFGAVCSVPSAANVGCDAMQFVADFALYISLVILAVLIYLVSRDYSIAMMFSAVATFFAALFLVLFVHGAVLEFQTYNQARNEIKELEDINFVLDGFVDERPRAFVGGEFNDLPHAKITETLPKYGLFIGCGDNGVYKYDVRFKSVSYLHHENNFKCKDINQKGNQLQVVSDNEKSTEEGKSTPEKYSFDLDQPLISKNINSYDVAETLKSGSQIPSISSPVELFEETQKCNRSGDCVSLDEGDVLLEPNSGEYRDLGLRNVDTIIHLHKNILLLHTTGAPGHHNSITFAEPANAIAFVHSFYAYNYANDTLKVLAADSSQRQFILYPKYK